MVNPQPQSRPPSLSDVQKQASNCGLDIPKLEVLLQAIEQELIQRFLSDKYKAMFYFAATGLYSAEDLAEIFQHSSKNLNADFNHQIGCHLKLYFELDDDERVGITSLRRILFKKGYLVLDDILAARYAVNSKLEKSASDKNSTHQDTKN